LIRHPRWHARTTHFPAPVEREIFFVRTNPPLRPAMTEPNRARLVAKGRRMSSATVRFGLKPVPVSLIELPRTTTGGWMRSRAEAEEPPASPASESAVEAASNDAAMRMPLF